MWAVVEERGRADSGGAGGWGGGRGEGVGGREGALGSAPFVCRVASGPRARGGLATLVDQKRLGGLPGELFNSLAERARERGTQAKGRPAPPRPAPLHT